MPAEGSRAAGFGTLAFNPSTGEFDEKGPGECHTAQPPSKAAQMAALSKEAPDAVARMSAVEACTCIPACTSALTLTTTPVEDAMAICATSLLKAIALHVARAPCRALALTACCFQGDEHIECTVPGSNLAPSKHYYRSKDSFYM